jgi:hypothetical protein
MSKNINIIYITHSEKKPSGGGKIIYKHCEIINSLKNTLSSEIIHIKKKKTSKWIGSIKKKFKLYNEKYSGWQINDIEVNKNFKYDWFLNDVKIKNNLNFNFKNDFVIIPEIFAHFATDLFIKNKIKYAIFVQNGYALCSTNNFSKLNLAYKNAKFIISYSNDISKCINLAFPFCKNKILRISYSITVKKLPPNKKNIITYMPRKLPDHSKHLLFFLQNHLSKKWKILPLDGLSESEVYNNLLLSKIFLSFSKLEGLPLPPVEAALTGNKVIGYTGEGGKEYWKEPIFTEVKNGEFYNFVDKIILFTKKKNIFDKHKQYLKQLNTLNKRFSIKKEKINIIKLIKKIKNLYF